MNQAAARVVAKLRADPSAGDSNSPPSGSAFEVLRADFEEFGLNGYEARVLIGLLQLGSATAAQIASTSGIGRTSVYPVLDSLSQRRLVEALPGKLWTTPGRHQVLHRLYATAEERVRYLEERMEADEKLLAEIPMDTSSTLPYVHFITGADEVKSNYERLLAGVREELLMFVRPPYTWTSGQVNQAVLDMMARGVTSRVLFEESIEAPEAEPARREQAVYLAAGVQARVVESLPIKLAIFDRKDVFVVMQNPVLPEIGYPTTQLIEHPGYAAVQVDAFEHGWERGRPYTH